MSRRCATFSNSLVVPLSSVCIPQQAPDQLQLLLQVLDLALHNPQEFGLVNKQLPYCLPIDKTTDLVIGIDYLTMISGTYSGE